MELTIEGLTVTRGGRTVCAGIDAVIPSGARLAIVGPNGAGKSTLLAAIAGLIVPHAGAVRLGGNPAHVLRRPEVARIVALLEQAGPAPDALSVDDIVDLGTMPHRSGPHAMTDAQARARTRAALDAVGATHLARRQWATLSGGERQRVSIARALAQAPRILLLDEPTNHLDISAQLETLDFVARLDLTAVAALHDLNHASRWASHVLVLGAGRAVAFGPPSEVLTEELVETVFGVRATVVEHPRGGNVIVLESPGRGRAAHNEGIAP